MQTLNLTCLSEKELGKAPPHLLKFKQVSFEHINQSLQEIE